MTNELHEPLKNGNALNAFRESLSAGTARGQAAEWKASRAREKAAAARGLDLPDTSKLEAWRESRCAPAADAEKGTEQVGAKEARVPTAEDRLQALRDAGNAPARNPFEKPKDRGRDR